MEQSVWSRFCVSTVSRLQTTTLLTKNQATNLTCVLSSPSDSMSWLLQLLSICSNSVTDAEGAALISPVASWRELPWTMHQKSWGSDHVPLWYAGCTYMDSAQALEPALQELLTFCQQINGSRGGWWHANKNHGRTHCERNGQTHSYNTGVDLQRHYSVFWPTGKQQLLCTIVIIHTTLFFWTTSTCP
jgi:hypothetical protein